ncbi:hypothetical protein [Echinimonas agarilytica]|uniref:Mpv17 / PMP22 family protein n=1 Tax=Echinimonas agarilytica TaxID=1215918 RepID=A0AA41W893_9GAMM|nr:hypothetical protein [Echinimonas agarilytica]MCM2680779.1 hypothetical protein [Echinimonas agarilytica]
MLLPLIKDAFRHNLKPALALQSLAIVLVLSYYFVPSTQPAFNFFADLKSTYGIRYAIISTAIFGGLLPFIYLLWTGQIKRQPVGQLIFYVVLWAWQGACVDVLYTYQGIWFGHATDIATLATKVAVDQFIFSAFYAAPFLTLMMLWKEQGFNAVKWKASLNRSLFMLKLPANIASNWLVWIPAVTAIYSMPAPLQVPLFNLVLCFYVLLLAVLNRDENQ